MRIINILALFVLVFSIKPVFAQNDDSTAWDALLDVNYRYEVAGYCGLVDQQVQRGYQAEEQKLADQFEVSKELRQQASGKGWQAAHKEWLNRGLGGFKRWCRNEGMEYAGAFSNQNKSNE